MINYRSLIEYNMDDSDKILNNVIDKYVDDQMNNDSYESKDFEKELKKKLGLDQNEDIKGSIDNGKYKYEQEEICDNLYGKIFNRLEYGLDEKFKECLSKLDPYEDDHIDLIDFCKDQKLYNFFPLYNFRILNGQQSDENALFIYDEILKENKNVTFFSLLTKPKETVKIINSLLDEFLKNSEKIEREVEGGENDLGLPVLPKPALIKNSINGILKDSEDSKDSLETRLRELNSKNTKKPKQVNKYATKKLEYYDFSSPDNPYSLRKYITKKISELKQNLVDEYASTIKKEIDIGKIEDGFYLKPNEFYDVSDFNFLIKTLLEFGNQSSNNSKPENQRVEIEEFLDQISQDQKTSCVKKNKILSDFLEGCKKNIDTSPDEYKDVLDLFVRLYIVKINDNDMMDILSKCEIIIIENNNTYKYRQTGYPIDEKNGEVDLYRGQFKFKYLNKLLNLLSINIEAKKKIEKSLKPNDENLNSVKDNLPSMLLGKKQPSITNSVSFPNGSLKKTIDSLPDKDVERIEKSLKSESIVTDNESLNEAIKNDTFQNFLKNNSNAKESKLSAGDLMRAASSSFIRVASQASNNVAEALGKTASFSGPISLATRKRDGQKRSMKNRKVSKSLKKKNRKVSKSLKKKNRKVSKSLKKKNRKVSKSLKKKNRKISKSLKKKNRKISKSLKKNRKATSSPKNNFRW